MYKRQIKDRDGNSVADGGIQITNESFRIKKIAASFWQIMDDPAGGSSEPQVTTVVTTTPGDGSNGTTISGSTLVPEPGDNYWRVDLSVLAEGTVADPTEFVLNIGTQVEPHTVTVKILNDSASETRHLRINHAGERDGNGSNGDAIIFNQLSDAALLQAITAGTTFTGYDVALSHLVRIGGTSTGGAAREYPGNAVGDSDFIMAEFHVNAQYIAIDVGTIDAEWRRITSYDKATGVVTLESPLNKAHPAGSDIVCSEINSIKVSWWEDGVENDTTVSQAAIGEAIEGTQVNYDGKEYNFVPTGASGNNTSLAISGSVVDAPDFVSVLIDQKRNLSLVGNGATINSPRGYDFFFFACENVSVSGFHANNPTYNPTDAVNGTLPVDYQACFAIFNYCSGVTVCENVVRRRYRGIMVYRSFGAIVKDNHCYNCRYAAIYTAGQLFQPVGWSLPNLFTSFFTDPPVFGNDKFIITSNHLRDFGTHGIYASPDSQVCNNTLVTNIDVSGFSTPITIGIRFGRGTSTANSNYISLQTDPSISDGSSTSTGIASFFDDIATGAKVLDCNIHDNVIEGGSVGVSVAESENTRVYGNNIKNYSRSGINIVASGVLNSNLQNIKVYENTIGNVNPNVTTSVLPYTWIGGIVLSRDGTPQIENVEIYDNYFDRKVSEIINAAAQTNHRFAIRAQATSSDTVYVSKNVTTSDSGVIEMPTNLGFDGGGNSNFINVPTSGSLQLESIQKDKVIVFVKPTFAATTVTLPEDAVQGQEIIVLNLSLIHI